MSLFPNGGLFVQLPLYPFISKETEYLPRGVLLSQYLPRGALLSLYLPRGPLLSQYLPRCV